MNHPARSPVGRVSSTEARAPRADDAAVPETRPSRPVLMRRPSAPPGESVPGAAAHGAAPQGTGLGSTPPRREPYRHVPYVALGEQFAAEREQLMPLLEQTLASGQWVGGQAVEHFEQQIAELVGAPHAVAVGSGTDALILALRALGIGPGDEVITAPNSFIATAGAITQVGATPVFADVLPDQNLDPARVAAAITPRTRALLPVHLSGRVARMPQLLALAKAHDLAVVEDAAQAIGAKLGGRSAGAFGTLGCFSAHPLKNLNAAGDAGFIIARSSELAARLRRLRNHGLVTRDTALEWGGVSRLDTLQATILSFRLERLDAVTQARRANAKRYQQGLRDLKPVWFPPCRDDEHNVFHTFVIQAERRDELRRHLLAHGIDSAVHYGRPLHLQPAAQSLGYGIGSLPVAEEQATRILSLPVHPLVGAQDIEHVCTQIREFYS